MKITKFTFCLLLVSASIFAQVSNKKLEIGVPKVTTFLPNDYNGEAQNFDFIQDDNGVMYVANTGGFLEFNGVKWRSFNTDNKGLPICFAKDTNGRIYAGGTEFMGYFDTNTQGEKYFISLKDKLPKDFFIGFVWNVFTINNTVFFKNDTNIVKFNGNKCTIVTSEYPIKWLIKSNKSLYISTQKGLFKIVKNSFEFVEGTAFFKEFMVRNIIQKNNTQKYIFTLKNGIFLFDDTTKKATKIPSELNKFLVENYMSYVTELTDGNIAISTLKGGLVLVDANLKPVFRITDKSGLTNNNVKRVVQDYQQNLWIGTDRGIIKINYPIQTTFFSKNNQKIGTIEEITSYKNSIYIGASRGVFKLNPISQKDLLTDHHFAQFTHLPNDGINAFANIVYHDKLYFGAYNKMMVFDGKTSKKINGLNPRKFYKSIYHKNVLFLGHSFGCDILFFDEKGNLKKTKRLTEIKAEIRGVAEDKYHNLWLTSVSNGVYKVRLSKNFEVKSVHHYTKKEGLPSLRDILVYNISNNDVVFTTHKGFFKFDTTNNKFVADSLFGQQYAGGKNEFIYAFNFDKKQQAWIHSFRKKESAVANLNDQGKYQINDTNFTEINHMQVYDILSEPDKNTVWFGGADGLARLNTAVTKSTNKNVFNAVISKVINAKDSVVVSGHQFDVSSTIELKNKDIRFEVGVTDFEDISKNKFQYYLEGYDTNWSDWSSEAFKIYTNLNHGNYTFKVRAKNVKKQLSNTAYFSFLIYPKWYETTLFKILLLLFSVAFVGYITSFFSKRKFVKKVHEIQLKQAFEQEKQQAIIKEQEKGIKAMIDAQEKERGRIARELHDGVVQQIGSVILKARTLINTPASKELIKNLEESNQDLRNISHQMMPRALKELGILHALKDLLENSLQYAGISYTFEHFNVTQRLPKNIEITIYRVTQELINNIIKHSKATEVSVQLFVSGAFVILIVEDNGIGILSEKPKKGIGLLNITSRLDMVKGTVNFEPSPKSGTLVTLKIPIK